MPGKAAHEKKKRLSKGRAVRSERSSVLRALRQGRITIKDVLDDPPDALGTCYIYVLLRDVPKLGEKGMRKVLDDAETNPLELISELSPKKRAELYSALPERVKNLS